jgi:hypothetical protein
MRGEVEHVGNGDSGKDAQDQDGEKRAKPQRREDAPRRFRVVLLRFGLVVALSGITVTIHRVPLRVTEPVNPSASS